MNMKISVIVICAEPIIYLVLYYWHDCTFNSPSSGYDCSPSDFES